MATVYLARNVSDDTPVAVKFIRMEKLPPEFAGQFLRRFQQEARQMASLQHPNIVRVLASGYHGADPYLAMEYVAGGTLQDIPGKPLPWAEAIALIVPVVRALEFAHLHHIIHRDVKPANILLRSDGVPKLSDFGIAKNMAGGEATLGATLTATGALVGTPEYMAPEQARGGEIDHRVDIYALGVVLYELITGRRPFAADTPWEVLAKHLTEPVLRPSEIVSGLPGQADRILLRALAKNPQDRYATMGELAADLEAVRPAARRFPKNWMLAGSLAVIGLFSCIGIAALASSVARPFATPSPTSPASLTPRTTETTASSLPAASPFADDVTGHTPGRLPTLTPGTTLTRTGTPSATVSVSPSAPGPRDTATPRPPTPRVVPTQTATLATATPQLATDLPPTALPPTSVPQSTAIPTSPPTSLPPTTPPDTAPPPTDTAPPPTRPPTPTA